MTSEEIEKALQKGLLSVAEVKDILGVTHMHVVNLIRSGRLEALNVGNSDKHPLYRIPSESVKRLLEPISK